MVDRKAKRLVFGSVSVIGILGLAASVVANAGAGVPAPTPGPAGVPQNPNEGVGSDVEEVVVTATRSKEAVNRVPLSVLAFTQEDMEKAGVKQFEDLVRLSPGLTLNNTFAGGTNIAIRGIGSSAGSATTGIYIDDVPIQVRNLGYSATSIFPKIFDLDRVEVLRGPQGTLFGAGSEGGTVRFILPTPSLDKYDSFTRAEIADTEGGAPSYEIGEAAGGPIIPGALGFRVSAYLRHDGGYIDRVTGSGLAVVDPTGSLGGPSAHLNVTATPYKNSNFEDSGSFRLALRIEPIGALSIRPSFFFQQQRLHDDIDSFWLSASNPNKDQYAAPLFAQRPGFLNYTGEANLNRGDNEIYLPAVELEWSPGALAAYSTTSFLVTHKRQLIDATTGYLQNYNSILYPPSGYKAPDNNVDRDRTFTQELRLQSMDSDARLNWLLGAFYSHADQSSEEDIHPNFFDTICCYFGIPNLDNGPPFGPGSTDFQNIWGSPLLPDSTSYYGAFRALDDQAAGFGQVSFKPIDRLTLTAGVRIERDAIYFGAVFNGPENNLNAPFGSPCPIPVCLFDAPGPWAPQFPAGSAGTREISVTPKYTIAFQADPTDLYYATVSKGFRPGGGELALPTVCDSELIDLGYVGSDGKAQAPLTYKSDSVWNYEVGSKNQLLNNKVQIDANAYIIKWSSVQAQIVVPVCGYGFTDNFGNATSKGFDLATQFRPLIIRRLGSMSPTIERASIKASATEPGRPSSSAPAKRSTVVRPMECQRPG